MNKIIYNVLEKIENAGFEAYIIGGYVRDYILGKGSNDVDITTSALPKDISNIFPINKKNHSYGSTNFKINEINFDITTYRKDCEYSKRKPISIKYIKSIKEDILRRDFTINAIYMDKNENIFDELSGISDLNNKCIKLIGNNYKLKEDPLRILRAIRIATVLDFEIDKELSDGIKLYKNLISELSKERIKEEVDKIFLSKNFKKGLKLLNKYKILDIIGIKMKNIVYVEDLSSMWAQLELKKDFCFSKIEQNNIKDIQELIRIKKIDNKVLYKYGLYNCINAATINGTKKELILKKYDNLKLKSKKDLCVSFNEVSSILQIDNYDIVKIIIDEMIEEILNDKIDNNKIELKEYLLKRKKDLNGYKGNS